MVLPALLLGCTVGRSILARPDAGAVDAPAPQDIQDVPPIDSGTDVPPVDSGTDVPPIDSGTDVPPVDSGTDVPPVDSGTDVPPVDVPTVDVPAVDAPAVDVPDSGRPCGAGLSSCGGACLNLLTNSAHCGGCNKACPGTSACVSGSCVSVPPCSAPLTLCSGMCVNSQTSPSHCGACGMACATGQVCVNGACVGNGDLRFTLTWDRPGDVDLHVVPPCGTDIFWMNRMACGGTLDRDDTTGTGPENVFFPTGSTRGSYLVCVVPFNITGPTLPRVEVWSGATLLQTFAATSAMSTSASGPAPCSSSSPFLIGEITY